MSQRWLEPQRLDTTRGSRYLSAEVRVADEVFAPDDAESFPVLVNQSAEAGQDLELDDDPRPPIADASSVTQR
jgi:hypothetical protein